MWQEGGGCAREWTLPGVVTFSSKYKGTLQVNTESFMEKKNTASNLNRFSVFLPAIFFELVTGSL